MSHHGPTIPRPLTAQPSVLETGIIAGRTGDYRGWDAGAAMARAAAPSQRGWEAGAALSRAAALPWEACVRPLKLPLAA